MQRAGWKDDRVQSEFSIWAQRLQMDRALFEERLWSAGERLVAVHDVIDAPFAPYFLLSGNRQRWPMFSAAADVFDRYEVRARPCVVDEEERCAWQQLYVTGLSLDDRVRGLASILDAPRVRSLASIGSFRGQGSVRRRACSAVAAFVFASDSTIVEVECAFLRERARAPGAAPAVGAAGAGLGERHRALRFTRESLAASQLQRDRP